ncbi:ABC transporter ATP-binding protein [Rhizobium sp. 0TCS1.26]|uniref:ABC transporter ATP-binding protein n=1 Tax=Rhizobium sp. 0TCS1.26 TaxID=3142623 RepID=UPI003D2E8B0A
MIEIDAVSKLYGALPAVDDVSMTIAPRSIAAVVGTSGSGKTTLLRMINRLVEPSAGSIRLDGEDNRSIPGYVLRRRIGYAIQGHGLFPHRTVAENIATVPRLLGWGTSRIKDKVEELLTLFQLEPGVFAGRYPHELSGGQQQRVGVARALAAEPNVLLMDEPFGALDPVIRAKAQDDLVAIQKHLKTTIVLVTHDMDEAFRLADMIAVMDQGRLIQYAKPVDLVRHPASDFVGTMVGDGQRPFRLLAISKVADVVEAGEAEGAAIGAGSTQQDALAELIWSRRDALPVVSEEGAPLGRVTLKSLLQHAAAER